MKARVAAMTILASGSLIFSSSPIDAEPSKAVEGSAPASEPTTLDRSSIVEPFRSWWYGGHLRPEGGSSAIARLKSLYVGDPSDAEARWWISRMQVSRQADTGVSVSELMAKCVEAKFPPAMAMRGFQLIEHPIANEDVATGLRLLADAYAARDPDAAIALGTVAADGRAGFQKDLATAEAYFRQATTWGTIRAHWGLTEVLARGNRDTEAFNELNLGANLGDIRCIERLAITYREGGLGQKIDERAAVIWMKKGSEAGSPRMQCELAKALIAQYSGVDYDEGLVKRLLELAAGASDKEARLLIAQATLVGKFGFAQDLKRAGEMLLTLCNESYPPALFFLAKAHLEGQVFSTTLSKTVAKREALEMMKASAKAGYQPAIDYLSSHDAS